MTVGGFMPHIVSASRRTDIPQHFGAWFAARRKAGFCESRNAFGGKYRISLRPGDVLGYLFWSKNTAPFEGQLRALRGEGAPVAVQFTITGYGPAVEAAVPGPEVAVPAFLRASRMLPSPSAIQWRYDPIVVTAAFGADWHRDNFRRIASALEGAVRVCNISFVEPYLKVVRRMGKEVAYRPADPTRHRQALRKWPDLGQAGAPEARLVEDLARIAREHGIELRSCCGPETGLPASSCCGADLFECYGIREASPPPAPGPTRKGCRCLKSLDIGMDDTCPGGCIYCYAASGPGTAERNARNVSPDAARLR
jgi:hypothetical protein